MASNHGPDRFGRDSAAMVSRREIRQAEEFKWCCDTNIHDRQTRTMFDPSRVVIRRKGKVIPAKRLGLTEELKDARIQAK